MSKNTKQITAKMGVATLMVGITLVMGCGVAAATTTDVSLVKGWNLLNIPFEPTTPSVNELLAQQGYLSVWAWDAATMKWQVKLASGDTAAYVTDKGFSSLSELHAGQGFWLNMNASGTLSVSGTATTSSTTLVPGWNLVGATSDQVTSLPDLLTTLAAAGHHPLSLWKWQNGNWTVALPYNADGTAMPDGGAAYAASKGFASISSLAATEGYWVNTTNNGNPLDLPPEVGKAYQTTAANTFLPLANAPLFKDGVQIGTTDTNGNFSLLPLLPSEVITIGSGSEYTVSASPVTGGALYLFTQEQDSNKVVLQATGSDSPIPGSMSITSSNGQAKITISNMELSTDIIAAATPYASPLSIPEVNTIKQLDPSYTVVGGADVVFTDSPATSDGAATSVFSGQVLAEAKNFISEYQGEALYNLLNPRTKTGTLGAPIGSLALLEYAAGAWKYVGPAQIIPMDTADPQTDSDTALPTPKKYFLKGAQSLTGLNPFVFVYASEYIQGSIHVTVSNGGLLFKTASGEELVTVDTAGKGAVSEESYTDKVANALVTTDSSDLFTTTNVNGAAMIKYNLPPNDPNISLLIKKNGYFDATAIVNVKKDTDVSVTMLEVPGMAAIGGVIRDALSTSGIENSEVTLSNPMVLDDVVVDGGTVHVGLDETATYTWEIRKQGCPATSPWYTIAAGSGQKGVDANNNPTYFNTIGKEEIKQKLVIGYANLDEAAKQVIGANPVGTYDVKITVSHPEANGDYIESASGYLDITLDLDKYKTGVISGMLGQEVMLFGGGDTGYFFVQGPPLTEGAKESYQWTASIASYDNGTTTTLAATAPVDSAFYQFTDIMNFAQENYLALLADGGFKDESQQGLTYLQSGVSVMIKMKAEYDFNGNGVIDLNSPTPEQVTLTAQLDIASPKESDPYGTDPLTVSKLQILPNTTMAFVAKQLSSDDGSYLFSYLDPQLSGKLKLSAAANGYLPSSKLLTEATTGQCGDSGDLGCGLIAGGLTTANVTLSPDPSLP